MRWSQPFGDYFAVAGSVRRQIPDWLPSVVIAGLAIALMLWIPERVAPGLWRAWLTGTPLTTNGPRRNLSRHRTLAAWIRVVVAVLGVVWLVYYVLSQPRPPG